MRVEKWRLDVGHCGEGMPPAKVPADYHQGGCLCRSVSFSGQSTRRRTGTNMGFSFAPRSFSAGARTLHPLPRSKPSAPALNSSIATAIPTTARCRPSSDLRASRPAVTGTVAHAVSLSAGSGQCLANLSRRQHAGRVDGGDAAAAQGALKVGDSLAAGGRGHGDRSYRRQPMLRWTSGGRDHAGSMVLINFPFGCLANASLANCRYVACATSLI